MRHDLLILFFILLSSALMADEHSNEAPSFKVQGIVTDEKEPHWNAHPPSMLTTKE